MAAGQEPTDEELLIQFRVPGREQVAFAAILARYQRRVYWHIRSMVVVHADADDLVQETFLKVWRHLGNFRGESGLFTWIYRIATNECLSHLQRQKRRQTVSLDGTDEDGAGAIDLIADDYFDGNEAEKQLAQALQLLPPKQRLVFNLRYLDEMPYEQMAEITGTSIGALKASYHHASKKVEEYLKKSIQH